MSYATGNNPHNENGAEFHEKIEVEVRTISGEFVEKVVRTVMTNEGKRYITYKRKKYQVKKIKTGDVYKLKIMGR
jgi:hypothetical protein